MMTTWRPLEALSPMWVTCGIGCTRTHRERHSIRIRAQQWRRSLTESVSTCGQYRALDVLGRRALQGDCAAATVVVVTCDTGHEQT